MAEYKRADEHSDPSVRAGVDTSTFEVSSIEAKEASGSAADGSVSGQGGQAAGQGSGVSAATFKLYWDFTEKKYKVFEPEVVLPGGQSKSPDEPEGGYADGSTYYCNVYKYKEDKGAVGLNYECKIEDELPESSEETEVVVSVKLFTIGDGPGKTKQFHTGAIVISGVGGGTFTGDNGKDEGSEAGVISGAIRVLGATPPNDGGLTDSTIKVRTYAPSDDPNGDYNGKMSIETCGLTKNNFTIVTSIEMQSDGLVAMGFSGRIVGGLFFSDQTEAGVVSTVGTVIHDISDCEQ